MLTVYSFHPLMSCTTLSFAVSQIRDTLITPSPSSTSCGGHLIPPGTFSFAFLLQAAANFKSLNAGTQLHALSIHHGLEADLFVGTTLVSMYAECGCVSSARKAFGEMPQPNVVAWNVVVTVCFRLKWCEGCWVSLCCDALEEPNFLESHACWLCKGWGAWIS